MDDKLTRKDLSTITKVPSSCIQVWTDRNIIIPAKPSVGKGTTRLYDIENAIQVRIIKELQKYGIPLNLIKSIIAGNKEKIERKWKTACLKYNPNYPEFYLIIKNVDSKNDIKCFIHEKPPGEFVLKLNMSNYENLLVLRITKILKETINIY